MLVASGGCDNHTLREPHGQSLILLQCKGNSARLNALVQKMQTSIYDYVATTEEMAFKDINAVHAHVRT